MVALTDPLNELYVDLSFTIKYCLFFEVGYFMSKTEYPEPTFFSQSLPASIFAHSLRINDLLSVLLQLAN